MLTLIMALTLVGDVYDDTPLTVNLDPDWVPGTYSEWLQEAPAFQPFSARTIMATDDSADFLILFQEGLTDSLTPGLLDQWVADIVLQGLSVEVVEVSYSEPTELREYLQVKHADGLQGAVLVGNLPAPWSALDNEFLDDSEMFPSDYFYMDLDGTWEDLWIGYPSQDRPGSDGMWDTWKDDLGPEIYFGRIRVDNLSDLGDPTDMLNAYLERNHLWRTVAPSGEPSALCYVDDDWATFGPGYQSAMEYLYDNVVLVNDPDSTNGTDYLNNRLPGEWEWISPYVHSSPLLHQWSPGPSTYWYDILPAQPQARFYNLFACSNTRFTTPRNMGGVYTFCTSTGLATIGSTKSGSMLSFGQFYFPLGQGASIGAAYAEWWEYIAQGGLTSSQKAWHLGMALLGDPTLVPGWYILGIDEGEPAEWEGSSLRPSCNPCSGSVTFLASGDAQGTLTLYDTSGRQVGYGLISGGICELDVTRLEPGVYFARVGEGAASAIASVVVSR